MAKTKKPRGGKQQGIMGRTDIPYAQRMALKQKSDIAASRDHAAKIAMFCTSVAMHELEGIGYKRLVRFSLHFKEIVDEFYEEPELGMAHAQRRMEQFGMPISGELFYQQVPGLSRRSQEIHDHSLQAAQIALICSAIAMNDLFHFGQERQQKISEKVNELTGRYAREGEKWLLEEMEKIGFQIQNGVVAAYIDDDGEAVTPGRARREWNLS